MMENFFSRSSGVFSPENKKRAPQRNAFFVFENSVLERRVGEVNVAGVDGDVFSESPLFVVDEELEGDGFRFRFGNPMPFRAAVAEHRNALFPAQAGAFSADVEHVAPSHINISDDARDTLRGFLRCCRFCGNLFCGSFRYGCFGDRSFCCRRFFCGFLGDNCLLRRSRGCGCFLFRAALSSCGLCCFLHIR